MSFYFKLVTQLFTNARQHKGRVAQSSWKERNIGSNCMKTSYFSKMSKYPFQKHQIIQPCDKAMLVEVNLTEPSQLNKTRR